VEPRILFERGHPTVKFLAYFHAAAVSRAVEAVHEEFPELATM
jgi:hypothetical protein